MHKISFGVVFYLINKLIEYTLTLCDISNLDLRYDPRHAKMGLVLYVESVAPDQPSHSIAKSD